jgi:hypothetical protein
MKSLLCGCIEANVQRRTPNVQRRMQKSSEVDPIFFR